MRTLLGLDKPVFNLDGQPLMDSGRLITAGSIIANCLARGSSDEPARAMDVAIKIHGAKGDIELEDADFAVAEQAVREDRLTNNMAKAAALVVLNDSQKKDASKKK